jgi:peptidoglycan/LPS O-acetylase OafA/YrhL
MVIAVVLVLAVVAGWVAWRFIELGSAKKPAPPPVPVAAAVAASRATSQGASR